MPGEHMKRSDYSTVISMPGTGSLGHNGTPGLPLAYIFNRKSQDGLVIAGGTSEPSDLPAG